MVKQEYYYSISRKLLRSWRFQEERQGVTMSTFLTKGELVKLQEEGKLDLEMQIILTNDDFEDFPIMISTDISTEKRIYFSRCIDKINRVLADGLGEFPTGQIKWMEIANKILDPNSSIYKDMFKHIVEKNDLKNANVHFNDDRFIYKLKRRICKCR